MAWKRLHFEELSSTMDYIREIQWEPSDSEPYLVVTADYQTRGRGQKGNHWEAERGKNLLIAIRFMPEKVEASDQFLLSEAFALAIVDALKESAGQIGNFCVKWPNDIYYNDKKICGILLEHELSGEYIRQTIAGIGINVNQVRFTSDAPNPISLFQILGHETDRDRILNSLLSHFSAYYKMLQQGEKQQLHDAYCENLYRKKGFHPYKDSQSTFMAEIDFIEINGLLHLRDNEGCRRQYAFKEVSFI